MIGGIGAGRVKAVATGFAASPVTAEYRSHSTTSFAKQHNDPVHRPDEFCTSELPQRMRFGIGSSAQSLGIDDIG